MTAILEVFDLVKHYKSVCAVNGVSFAIEQGQCFGLLGPNGAGKTTTLEILEGIQTPTYGQVKLFGELWRKAHKSRLGIQFQSSALPDFLTVHDTLKLFRSFYNKTSTLEAVIAQCQLQEIIDRDHRHLSGGQRQRLLLALALINEPDIVFLDEPTTGLDPAARRQFWSLIDSLKRNGKTIVLTTHYMDEAQSLCDSIVIMDKGKVIASGAPRALLSSHFANAILKLPKHAIASIELPSNAIVQQDIVEFSFASIEKGMQWLLERNISLNGLEVKVPDLEDLFIKLTGHSLSNDTEAAAV